MPGAAASALKGTWDNLNLLNALYRCVVRMSSVPVYGTSPVKWFGTCPLTSADLGVSRLSCVLSTMEVNNPQKMVKVQQRGAAHQEHKWCLLVEASQSNMVPT